MSTSIHFKTRHAGLVTAAMVAASLDVVSSQFPPPPQPPTYTIKNLGILCVPQPEFGCESADSFAYGLNNWRQVVGASSVIQNLNGFPRLVLAAFRTGSDQAINPSTDQLHSSTSEGAAFAINASGVVVGSIAGPSAFNTIRAFRFAGSGPMSFLPSFLPCPPTLSPLVCNEAFGINNSGHVVGTSAVFVNLPQVTLHAFRLAPTLDDLGTLGGAESAAYDINDFGLIVGAADGTTIGARHAAIFAGASPLGLGTLGGDSCETCQSAAFAVNNGDVPPPSRTTAQIVGESDLSAAGPRHGFVLDLGPNSPGMQGLGTLCVAGDCDSAAYDINDLGHIVGESQFDPASLGTHAFLYKGGTMTDLNTVLAPSDQALWTLLQASGINAFGQIAGTGAFDGNRRAFLLTPPLPVIFETVKDLANLFLKTVSPRLAQSLRATLDATKAAMDRGDLAAARGALAAFEYQVKTATRGTQQNTLLAGAALIRALIEEGSRR